MFSGGLNQYIKEVKLSDPTLVEIKLVCPNIDRYDVLNNLWNDGWEITRSGPSVPDYTNQTIHAIKPIKILTKFSQGEFCL